MKRNDIVIGLVVLAVLAGAIFLIRRPKQKVGDLPPAVSTEDKIEDSFNVDIPDGLDKAELKDVSGGASSGIATRDFQNSRFTHMVLADLPEPTTGFYQGWLGKGESLVPTGRLRVAKGGYLLELNSATDYSDYNRVLVTLERIADSTPEETVLEGSF